MQKIKVSRAIIVEGRDDVDAVSKACDALIIPTHGYGIRKETWDLIAKAYDEKGIMILTDPDHAGEGIRRKLTEKFPGAVQCYMAREDSMSGDDIGIENACPQAIAQAVTRALELAEPSGAAERTNVSNPEMGDLIRLGLAGGMGSADLRVRVCRRLGIGHCNAKAMLTRLKGFSIGTDELEEAVKEELQ
ncbi:MAG: DUF4093 domain-containing protein [Lachnospiraceae bacterium]|nr:DUF4093 domain-containing protein [Lachnospiraceae bacterium]